MAEEKQQTKKTKQNKNKQKSQVSFLCFFPLLSRFKVLVLGALLVPGSAISCFFRFGKTQCVRTFHEGFNGRKKNKEKNNSYQELITSAGY